MLIQSERRRRGDEQHRRAADLGLDELPQGRLQVARPGGAARVRGALLCRRHGIDRRVRVRSAACGHV